MIPFSVKALCAAVNGTMLQSTDAAVTGVSTDSRTVTEGQLFIPLVGEKFDGHAYLHAALEKGAVGCLCEQAPETLLPGKFYIRVADTMLALKALASWYRSQFDIPVVEISGSAGKTTTKEMIAAVLSQHYPTLKTEANYNNFIGTPQTLLRLEQYHRAAVIETGLDHFGDLIYMGEMVRPTVAVLTNIGDAHIENLGNTREGTLRAKSEIFENLQPGGLAVLCGDDALLNTLKLPFPTLRCGKSEGCNVRVTDIVDRGIEGIDCTVTTEKDSYRLSIDLKPALDEQKLEARILRDVAENPNRGLDKIIGGLVHRSMVSVVLDKLDLSAGQKANALTKEQRRALIALLKHFPVAVSGTRPVEEAIVTTGGVKVGEVQPATMESKLLHGLYFAGEVLDVDAYTGGFNLQIAWATGRQAGRSAAEN